LKKCDLLLSIPQAGEIESLNVSVAAGIILYQIALKVGMLKCEIQK
jgi:tRNA G18 (ribose-2'-O)-methylase SpoU